MVLLEFVRGQVAEAGVRSHRVVVLPPCLDDDLGFAASAEPLDAQALVAKFAVEGLVRSVLPGLSRIDQCGFDARFADPLQDRMADELGAVVGSKVDGRTVNTHQSRQHLNDPRRADTPGDIDRQAFMGEFIDHGQAFELLAIGAGGDPKGVGLPDLTWQLFPEELEAFSLRTWGRTVYTEAEVPSKIDLDEAPGPISKKTYLRIIKALTRALADSHPNAMKKADGNILVGTVRDTGDAGVVGHLVKHEYAIEVKSATL